MDRASGPREAAVAPAARAAGAEDAGPGARLTGHPGLVHLAVLAGFLAAGVAASWPRATYLAGKLPATRDAGAYDWGFWWVLHQLAHLASPWFTRGIAAPVEGLEGGHLVSSQMRCQR